MRRDRLLVVVIVAVLLVLIVWKTSTNRGGHARDEAVTSDVIQAETDPLHEYYANYNNMLLHQAQRYDDDVSWHHEKAVIEERNRSLMQPQQQPKPPQLRNQQQQQVFHVNSIDDVAAMKVRHIFVAF